MTDLDAAWLRAFQEVANRAAHEVKDALNGVALNVEVVRSRSSAGDAPATAVAPFATAAADQLEVLGRRVEALLVLARPPREPTDVALTLRHLAELLVPAARADGGSLKVEGGERHAPTGAGGTATRLALVSGLLAVTAKGAHGRCGLDVAGGSAVVRFSHESAGDVPLDPALATLLAGHAIRCERSGTDLTFAFPGIS